MSNKNNSITTLSSTANEIITSKRLVDKFGPEVINYFSGSKLNRLSFLRTNYDFLNLALKHKSTRFIIFRDRKPAVKYIKDNESTSDLKKYENQKKGKLQFFNYETVKTIIGDPFIKDEEVMIKEWDSSIYKPILVFMGIDEEVKDKELSISYKNEKANIDYIGRAYFALDISDVSKGEIIEEVSDVPIKDSSIEVIEKKNSELENHSEDFEFSYDYKLQFDNGKQIDEEISKLLENFNGNGIEFSPVGYQNLLLDQNDAALFSHGIIYIDWNTRNKFCSGCGSRQMSINGGNKLICPSTDQAKTFLTIKDEKIGLVKIPRRKPGKDCPTRGVLTNTHFPRTDVVIIVATINSTGDKLLLARNKRFPKKFKLYSCVAGFIEPGESIEDATRREIWEETGVVASKVVIHSTQPWPFPANLMLGCIAQTDGSNDGKEEILLEHDTELLDAKWFDFDVVKKALLISKNATDSNFKLSKELIDEKKEIDGILSIPPPNAIAHTLIDAVVNRQFHFTKGVKL